MFCYSCNAIYTRTFQKLRDSPIVMVAYFQKQPILTSLEYGPIILLFFKYSCIACIFCHIIGFFSNLFMILVLKFLHAHKVTYTFVAVCQNIWMFNCIEVLFMSTQLLVEYRAQWIWHQITDRLNMAGTFIYLHITNILIIMFS